MLKFGDYFVLGSRNGVCVSDKSVGGKVLPIRNECEQQQHALPMVDVDTPTQAHGGARVARGYAACLGSIAFLVCLMRGLIALQSPLDILPSAIALAAVFTMIGWVIGALADHLIRQSLETKFRQSVQQYQDQRKPVAKDAKS